VAVTVGLNASVQASLAAQRSSLERTSTAERVADVIRHTIIDGTFRPGSRLSEPEICAALGVSRNTLREAFRSLAKDRLVSHELNRGVFVRIPTLQDIAEMYTCRRVVECAAVRNFSLDRHDLNPMREALELADGQYEAGDWNGVGTADIHFHKAIAGLNDSRRINEMMEGIWAELRLVFLAMGDPRKFHDPYFERNHEIADALVAGDGGTADKLMLSYLDDSEAQISTAYNDNRMSLR
jgi:DNA-binding GntR family transcriptional regulator